MTSLNNSSTTDSLNKQQEKIVNHGEGAALVIAGAGSGKTMVITRRVARLVMQGVSPRSILLLTFTNKSAREMLDRVGREICQDTAPAILGGTFHSIGNRFLRQYGANIGFDQNFTILDQLDARELIKLSTTEVVSKKDAKFPKAALQQSIFSLAFNKTMELNELIEKDFPWLMKFIGDLEAILNRYREKKRRINAMDFDDLLDNFLLLLHSEGKFPTLDRIQYVLVDEYQDTNQIQAEIVDLIAAKHKNLMVVGDDAQSIYGWRGAHFENILEFPKRYPKAIQYRLEVNYRSSQQILDLANCSINQNSYQFKKDLSALFQSEQLPIWQHYATSDEESDGVVDNVVNLQKDGLQLNDMCICYRSHSHAVIMQVILANRGIPFTIYSGVTFFEQAHVKDVLSFLRVLYNRCDELAWLRILKMIPGVGSITGQKIIQWIATHLDIPISSDQLLSLVPNKGKTRWENLIEMLKLVSGSETVVEMMPLILDKFYAVEIKSQFENWIERKDDLGALSTYAEKYDSLKHFLQDISLVNTTEVEKGHEEIEDRITLTTIHKAKGLEWDKVFVIGLNDGMFPASTNIDNEGKLEEERRLFYVALTRAKTGLYLSSPRTVSLWGQVKHYPVSRFVNELNQSLIEKEDLSQTTVSYHPLRF